jgi:hypothetical protein
MGLQSFERSLERMVEGVFNRGSKTSVRPVELGRRLLRQMDDHRTVDVKGRRIVPNHYVFHLSPRDHAGLADIDEVLVAELGEAAREYARDEQYHFMGPVSIELQVDNDLRPGRFEITSTIKESGQGVGPGTLVLASGQRVPVGAKPVTIGRLAECTLQLSDPNCSRRHAEVRPVGSGFVVADLGSTNGTKVNGLKIDGERTLADGDIITLGGTNLRFEAS